MTPFFCQLVVYMILIKPSCFNVLTTAYFWPNLDVMEVIMSQMLKLEYYNANEKKRSERRKHCARAGYSKVRTPPAHPHPLARPLSQTHRQDRLQYTAPQLASAQCKKAYPWPKIHLTSVCGSVLSCTATCEPCNKTHKSKVTYCCKLSVQPDYQRKSIMTNLLACLK